jgi:ubiquitin-like modifier-activating enzyme ATG7
MTSQTGATVLQFVPFASQIPSSFWASLAKIKVDRLQLSQESIQVLGRYSPGRNVVDRATGEEVPLPVGLHIDGEALQGSESGSSGRAEVGAVSESLFVELAGHLTNFNTIEDFKKADKGAILTGLGEELLRIIESDPEPLTKINTFTVLSFADLKKFKFIYWFAYPALLAKPSWQVCSDWEDAGNNFKTEQVSLNLCLRRDCRSTPPSHLYIS